MSHPEALDPIAVAMNLESVAGELMLQAPAAAARLAQAADVIRRQQNLIGTQRNEIDLLRHEHAVLRASADLSRSAARAA